MDLRCVTIFTSFTILFQSCISPIGDKADREGNCVIKTTGRPSANGINMWVYYPCTWQEMHSDGYAPELVAQVGNLSESIRVNKVLTVMIKKSNYALDDEKLDVLRRTVYATDSLKIRKGYISSDTLAIGGVKGGEIISKSVTDHGQIVYQLLIQLFSRGSLIQLIYTVGAYTEKEALGAFENERPFLMKLARKTRFF